MNIVWHWPQITWCILAFVGLIIHAVNNGEPIKTKYNFSVRALMSGFFLFLLYEGGFFAGASP